MEEGREGGNMRTMGQCCFWGGTDGAWAKAFSEVVMWDFGLHRCVSLKAV